jgi:hypothetical protein
VYCCATSGEQFAGGACSAISNSFGRSITICCVRPLGFHSG